MRQCFIVPGIPIIEELPVPAQRLVVETALNIEVDGFSIITLLGRITQKSLYLGLCALLVAGAPANEGFSDVTTQVDWLIFPARLGDMEDQQRLAVFLDQALVDRDDPVKPLA